MHRTFRRSAGGLAAVAAAAALLPAGAGALSFVPQAVVRTYDSPHSLVVADFDGDGLLDLANANSAYASSVSVLLGIAGGGYARRVNYPVGPATLANPAEIEAADVDGDGALDIVSATRLSGPAGAVAVLYGSGTGTFSAPIHFPTGAAPCSLEVVDFNGDGVLDALTADGPPTAGSVSVLLGDGSGGFSARTATAIGPSFAESLDTADFNGDGALDVVVSDGSARGVVVLFGDGAGGFTSSVRVPVGAEPDWVAAADMDGDGADDILSSDSGDDTITIVLGDGTGGFTGPTTTITSPYLRPEQIVTADFDGDGIRDLATGTSASGRIWRGLGGGAYLALGGLGGGLGPGVESLAVADFNADGRPDLAGAAWMNNRLGVYINT